MVVVCAVERVLRGVAVPVLQRYRGEWRVSPCRDGQDTIDDDLDDHTDPEKEDLYAFLRLFCGAKVDLSRFSCAFHRRREQYRCRHDRGWCSLCCAHLSGRSRGRDRRWGRQQRRRKRQLLLDLLLRRGRKAGLTACRGWRPQRCVLYTHCQHLIDWEAAV